MLLNTSPRIELIVDALTVRRPRPALVLRDHPGEVAEGGIHRRRDVVRRDVVRRVLPADEERDCLHHGVGDLGLQGDAAADHLVREGRRDVIAVRAAHDVRHERTRVDVVRTVAAAFQIQWVLSP